ncbi:MAG: multicopper oxidase family protein [Gemmatimonadales bacterium]
MRTLFLTALTIVCAGALSAQTIPGVSALCADRPGATGQSLSQPPARPSRTGSRFGRPASDLFCVDLLPTTNGGRAAGVVELGRVQSAFGVALNADGNQLHNLTAWIRDLPDPRSLGPYQTYVAWVTTAVLDPVLKLGEVRNGKNALGEVHFNKFMILVTAEASAEVQERTGRLVLRGRSPSMLMEGHDLLAQAPSALQPAKPTGVDRGWAIPPMYPDVTMLPGMRGLAPETDPLALAVDTIDLLPEAMPRQVVRLGNGGTLDLEAGVVRRQLRGRTLIMLAFNNQHPGPLITVPESATVFVNVINKTPYPTTVHWHGVRLDNRFDGVPGVTQDPILPGESFRYQIFFPDAGIYWYHPHHREDVQQELGLYGNMLVESTHPDYFSPVNREEVLMLDDLLLGDRGIVPFGEAHANYSLMGRFGNVFLVNGEPTYEIDVRRGEVVRFFLTNVSNTRTFNVSFTSNSGDHPALPMKVVGSDIGKFERERWTESAVLAPAERYIVEVQFPSSGTYAFVNHVQGINHRTGTFLPEATTLGSVQVADVRTEHDHGDAFQVLRENTDVIADIDRYRADFDRPVDHELVMTLRVDSLPLVIEQVMLWDWVYFNPVDWTGTMPIMNWATTGHEVRWVLRDPATGRENEDIDWTFRVGDVAKIRVYNDRDAFHAMQHPLHIHGQRFLVLEQNGVKNDNLAWKDTVLLPTGSTTDILLDITNPGRWMVHCHIAEHLESGMRFAFDVEESL